MYKEEDAALAALNRGIDLGITYLDTAFSYGDGTSETRVGKLMGVRRKDIFLATKIPDRTRDAFMKRLEASLKRLQVDHVDLLHIHSLGRDEDLAAIEAPDGALKGLLEARDQKMTRFIGMTSHTDGAVLARAIERHPLNCVQMALNPSRNGRFEELALPAAKRKNLGIIAMKVTGQEFLLKEKATVGVDSLLRYSLSLPVTVAVIGMPALEFIDQNTGIAAKFSPLSNEEMDHLRSSFEPLRGPMEKRLVGHLDGPTRSPEIFWA
jgi:aryl-alcohol dehydrogenase-like predicted oxidoreductase